MDVFALQEELDAAKVARASHARASGTTATLHRGSTSKERDVGNIEKEPTATSSDDSAPPQFVRDDDTGVMMAAPTLHPHSAEYKLRQRYFVFSDEIIGRGAFGEVLLAQLRDVPIVGKSTFIPISALLGPSVGTSNGSIVRVPQSVVQHMSTATMSPTMMGAHGGLSMSALSLGGISMSVHMSQTAGSVVSGAPLGDKEGHTSPSSSPAQLTSSAAAAKQLDIPLFAVKKIDKSKTSHKGLSQLLSEVETLSLLNHSNIVKLQEVFQDQKHMFIVMEYVKGGELGKVLKRVGHFSETVAKKICMSILLAIEYIHEKGIVHRDLKPANCLLTKDTVFSSSTAFHFAQLHSQATHVMDDDHTHHQTSLSNNVSPVSSPVISAPNSAPPFEFTPDDYAGLKIADFGFAAMVGRAECLTSYCGTMHYMAPEVAGREGTNYGKPVDMWSFGVIVYNLLSGDLPFTGSTTERLVEAIGSGTVVFGPNPRTGVNMWNRISPQAKDFIQKLLVVDPNRRLTAQEALRHPWIRSEYSDEDFGDYPTTKGVLRAHSKFMKSRTLRHRLLGCFQAAVAAHRLVFLARLQAMRREGIAEIPSLRNFPFVVHGIYEPPNHIASAASKRFSSNIPALKRLTEMVAASHTVEVLDVSGNNIDDLGLVQLIVKVTFAHPSLTHLNMERNPIPALAARALLRLARSPTHKLNIINVNHTSLGVDVIAQIDASLKETIRKRAEAAQAAAVYGGMGNTAGSPIVASSSILRHDGNALRLGLMQSLTASGSLVNSPTGMIMHGGRLSVAVSPARAMSPSGNNSAAATMQYRPPSVLSGSGSGSTAATPSNSSSLLSSPQFARGGATGTAFSPLARPSHGPAILLRRAHNNATLPPLQAQLAPSLEEQNHPSSTTATNAAARLRAAGGDRVATGAAANVARQNTSAQRR
jgi:serine/threonine protein kinase